LLRYLRNDYGIFALGTIRTNRLRGAQKKLPTDKNLKKKRQRVLRTSRMFERTDAGITNKTYRSIIKTIHKPVAERPPDVVRFDQVAHYPTIASTRGR
ncbi:hypothetical protein SFRURICE_012193, partial [Spodoptera frugiperda]